MFDILLCSILLFGLSLQDNVTERPKDLIEVLRENHIVPYIIEKPPNKTCQVRYPNDVEVEPGMRINQTIMTKKVPKITWEAEPRTYYTLYHMIANVHEWYYYNITSVKPPEGHYKTQLIKWLVYNIPKNEISRGKTLYKFSWPREPDSLYPELYLFIIFKQPRKVVLNYTTDYRHTMIPGTHPYTPLNYFIKNFNFTMIALNFFHYEYDYWTAYKEISPMTLVPKKFFKIEYQTPIREVPCK